MVFVIINTNNYYLISSEFIITIISNLYIDTLACYPYEEDDPFIINEQCLPKLYFAGNQVCKEGRSIII
jgi:hypothetical protein